MGEMTSIGWTDHSFNGWLGCTEVSEACRPCYAKVFTRTRMGLNVWGQDAPRYEISEKTWGNLNLWDRKAAKEGVRRKVFCFSFADVFEELPEGHQQHETINRLRAKLFAIIEELRWLDVQLLTKRPQNVARMVPPAWMTGAWPKHAWLGCTVENARRGDERIPILRGIPAPVRFLSIEPMFGPVVEMLERHLCTFGDDGVPDGARGGVEWIIVGGESGSSKEKRHELDLDEVKRLRRLCNDIAVPLFVKQDSAHSSGQQGRIPDDLWAVKQFPSTPMQFGSAVVPAEPAQKPDPSQLSLIGDR